DRRRDRAGAAGHRGLQAEAVRLLRHQHGELPHAARLRQRDRDRHHHLGLRARDRARRVQPQLPHRSRRGGLLRPLAGEPRDQPVRQEREIRGRGEALRGAGVLRRPAERSFRSAEGLPRASSTAAHRREHVSAATPLPPGRLEMNIRRRRFLRLTAGAAAFPLTLRVAAAQAYPSRPVRLLVGVAAGRTTDIVARLIGQWLSERFGQQLIIENRPGAGSNIATEAVVKATADGYTLLMVAPVAAINATLYEKLNFNFLRDMAPVAGVVRVPNVLTVNPTLPVKTVPELIDLAKAKPGTLSFASAGVGTASHLAGEMFKARTGVDLIHVAYRGDGPAMTDLIGAQ